MNGIWRDGAFILASTLECQLETERARVKELEDTFRHMFLDYGDDSDICKSCGLEFKDRVHRKADNENTSTRLE